MKKILCFGNPYLDMDNSIFEIIKGIKLNNFEFIKCESFTDLLNYKNEKEIIILDTVKNIKKPIIIDDLDKLKDHKSVTLHDFDLSFNLKLLEEINEIGDVKIIGIPQKGNVRGIKKELAKSLSFLDQEQSKRQLRLKKQ